MINTNYNYNLYSDDSVVITKELGAKIIAAIAKILPELNGDDIVNAAKLIDAINSGIVYKGIKYTFTWGPNFSSPKLDTIGPNEWIVTC